jgi:hypothetical protein
MPDAQIIPFPTPTPDIEQQLLDVIGEDDVPD